MLAITCSAVPTASHRTLVPESRVLSVSDDGAGTITVLVACYAGHLHTVVTGRGAASTPASRVPAAA